MSNESCRDEVSQDAKSGTTLSPNRSGAEKAAAIDNAASDVEVSQNAKSDAPLSPNQSAGGDEGIVDSATKKSELAALEDRIQKAELWMIWLTAAIAFFGLCSVVVGLLQWNAMKGQLKEMHDSGIDTHTAAEAAKTQTDITKKVTESNNEAVLDVRAEPSIGQNREHVSLVNTGRVNAEHVSCHVEITRKSLPDFRTIAVLKTDDIYEDEILASKAAERMLEIALTDRDRERVISRAEAIVASGTIHYDNGFGTIKNPAFCTAYVSQLDANGGWLPQCRDIAIFLKDLAVQEQHDRERDKKSN